MPDALTFGRIAYEDYEPYLRRRDPSLVPTGIVRLHTATGRLRDVKVTEAQLIGMVGDIAVVLNRLRIQREKA